MKVSWKAAVPAWASTGEESPFGSEQVKFSLADGLKQIVITLDIEK
jgi:hypothetical protein